MLKLKSNYVILLALIVTSFSSCQVIGGIFKAGVWVGAIIIIVIIAIIFWLFSKASKK